MTPIDSAPFDHGSSRCAAVLGAGRVALIVLALFQVAPLQAAPEGALERSVEELRTTIGRWEVTTEFLNPDGSVARSVDGVYEFSWVVPDRVVVGRNAIPEFSQASGILFYVDESNAEIEMVSVGADGNLWVMTGPLGGDTRHTQEFAAADGTLSQLRFTRYNVTDDSFESRMERRVVADDGGETWVPGNHQVFRRALGSESAGTVIYLVRHAEAQYPPPADAPRDPPLNAMGRERAEALARLLKDSAIATVLSSDYRRTRQTAAPIAAALGIEVEVYDPGNLISLADRLRGAREPVLVVGHSNTTPHLADLLGGDAGAPIDESSEFDRLYLITLGPARTASTSLLRYGAPTPENWKELAKEP